MHQITAERPQHAAPAVDRSHIETAGRCGTDHRWPRGPSHSRRRTAATRLSSQVPLRVVGARGPSIVLIVWHTRSGHGPLKHALSTVG